MVPVIGVSCYVERARWGVWDKPAALLPYGYVQRLREAGARPVLLPPDPDADVDLVRRFDGLVFAGGADVEPDRYGAARHPESSTRPERDAGEFPLLAAALKLDLPVLGVCRGAELLTVAYGGTLHQHLPDLVGGAHHQPSAAVYGRHEVRFAAGSLAARLHGERTMVDSYHHQAVADPGDLVVTGWAADGVIEAVEDPERRFVLGVQWHPEETGDVRPFAALVRAAAGD